MRLTIIVVDGAVGKDGVFYDRLDLTSCQIPNNIWALQWDGASGHIEFDTPIPNEDITSLPVWATACLSVWEAKDYLVKNPPPSVCITVALMVILLKNLFAHAWVV